MKTRMVSWVSKIILKRPTAIGLTPSISNTLANVLQAALLATVILLFLATPFVNCSPLFYGPPDQIVLSKVGTAVSLPGKMWDAFSGLYRSFFLRWELKTPYL